MPSKQPFKRHRVIDQPDLPAASLQAAAQEETLAQVLAACNGNMSVAPFPSRVSCAHPGATSQPPARPLKIG